jgi:TIR domain/Sel1 repeat/SPOR domain
MSGGVFICYRREESAFAARAIHDRVVQRLARENVFLDVDNIDLGVDWFNVLTERVGACDALVAVIGRNWVSSADKDNQRRIDDPDDFVRIEIEAALKRNVRVIPVFVDGAKMPKASELPESLKGLARRQGIEVSPAGFDADVEKLTHALRSILEQRRARDTAKVDEARQSGDEHRAPAVAEAARIAREERKRQGVAETAGGVKPVDPLAEAEALRMDQERLNEAAGPRRTPRSLAEPQSEVSARRYSRAIWLSSRWVWVVAGAVALAGSLSFTSSHLMNFRLGRVEKERAVPIPPAPQNESTWTLSPGNPAGSSEQAAAADKAATDKAAANKAAAGEVAAEMAAAIRGDQSFTPAQENELGDRYFYGRGVEQDYAKAMEWYRKAADQSYAPAQLMIGAFYEAGHNVSKDIREATRWYQQAADEGNAPATQALKLLHTAATADSDTANPPTGPSVQLGSPDSAAEAAIALASLNAKYGTQLNGLPITVRKAVVNGETRYRLRVAGLTQTDAVALCAHLKAKGGDCLTYSH